MTEAPRPGTQDLTEIDSPSGTAPSDARVDDLVTRWEQLWEQGQAVSAEELCRDSPELVDSLRRAIQALQPLPLPNEPPARAPETAPPSVAGYEVLSELGRGGMGVVYWVWQPGLHRTAALKMLLAGCHAGEQELARFRVETEAAARLQHPNIVQVYQVGEHEGRPFLVLEYVDGGTLAQKLTGTPVSARQAAELVESLAGAVHYAHQRGVVHRDLKPANILVNVGGRKVESSVASRTMDGSPRALPPPALTPEQLKIADFGLAKLVIGGDAGNTRTGLILGTPSYMAPEQAAGRGNDIGPATDVYALGAILYELITGRRPFQGATDLETLQQVQTQELVAPSRLRPKLPRDLETICVQCLQKEPARRYTSAEALADELRRFLADEPIRARPVGPAERLGRWCRRQPVVAGLTAAVALLLLVGTVGATLAAVTQHNLAAAAERARAEAEKAALQAEGARRAAEKARHQTEDLLERQYVAHAVRLMDAEDPHGALPWVIEGLRLAQGDPTQEEMHRYRLAAALRQSPSFLYAWFHERPVRHAVFSPDGYRVLTASEDWTARVWDAISGRPITPPLRHNGPVWHAAFSPDGTRVVTASTVWNGGEARVWGVSTGAPCTPPLKHARAVIHADFGADGSRVFTAGADGARVWEAATGKPVTQLLREDEELTAAALSPDGRRVVTASRTGTARLWDVTTSTTVGRLLGHKRSILRVMFSSFGTQVVTSSHDNTARLWQIGTDPPTARILRHDAAVWDVAFSPDGQRVVTAGHDHTAQVWNAADGQLLSRFLGHRGRIFRAAFSPDARWVVTASDDRTARVWDAATGQAVTPPLPHSGTVWHAAFGPDGDRVVTASEDATARVWLLSARPRPTLGHLAHVTHATFSPDGGWIATASQDRTARVRDAGTGKAVHAQPLEHRSFVREAWFSPDGHWLLTACSDRTARIWETATGEPRTRPLEHAEEVLHAAFSPDGRRVVTACGSSSESRYRGSARVWDAGTGEPVTPPLHTKADVGWAAFSPDGARVVTAGNDTRARVWEIAGGKQVLTLPHGGTVGQASFSPDGRWLLTTSAETARVWDADTGVPITDPFKHSSQVKYAEFSPDGRHVVTASYDGTARVWDAARGILVCPPLRHERRVFHAAFSPDGRRVVTASEDFTARVWDAATGEPLSPALRHAGWVNYAAFSPDGGRLVTAGGDGKARVWEVTAERRPVPDLVCLTQVLAGQQFQAPGKFLTLGLAQFRQDWLTLWSKYPDDLPSAPERAPGWEGREHYRQARVLMNRNEWEQAVAAYGRTIQHLIDDPGCRIERGAAHAALKQWDHAIADYTQAIVLDPNRPLPWIERGRLQLDTFGRCQEAVTDCSGAIALAPSDPMPWGVRGRARGALGQWQEAAADFAAAVDRDSDDPNLWFLHACSLLHAGEREEHRQVCSRVLERFSESTQPGTALYVARICTVVSQASADPMRLVRLAQHAVKTNPRAVTYLNVLATAHLRAGQFEEATRQARAALQATLQTSGTEAVSWLVLALAQARLGKANEARRCLDEAARRLDEGKDAWPDANSASASDVWSWAIEGRVLRREAEALLAKTSSAPQSE